MITPSVKNEKILAAQSDNCDENFLRHMIVVEDNSLPINARGDYPDALRVLYCSRTKNRPGVGPEMKC